MFLLLSKKSQDKVSNLEGILKKRWNVCRGALDLDLHNTCDVTVSEVTRQGPAGD